MQVLKAKADERAAGLAATLNALKAEGITSANAMLACSTLGTMRPLGAAGGRPGAFATSRLGWLEANPLRANDDETNAPLEFTLEG